MPTHADLTYDRAPAPRYPVRRVAQPRLQPMRWVAAAAVVAAVVFSSVYDVLGLGEGMRAVSDRYANAFTPAPYAFAIWAVIYAGLIAYAFIALAPSQRAIATHDRIAPWLTATSALLVLWIAAFTNDYVWPSVALIVALLTCAAMMYRRIDIGIATARITPWLRVPFSLLLAWISLATIANVAAALTASGYDGAPLGAEAWAGVMAVLAFALGVRLATHYRDAVIPAVLAWGLAALYVAERNPLVLATAIASGATALALPAVKRLARR